MKHIPQFIASLVFGLSSLANAQDSLMLTPSNLEAGSASIYELSFVTTDTLLPDGELSVTFPDGVVLSDLKIASSTTINGGFKVRVEGQKAILTRTGLGRRIAPRENVSVKFGVIKNPQLAGQVFAFQVEFDHKSKQPEPIVQRQRQIEIEFRANDD